MMSMMYFVLFMLVVNVFLSIGYFSKKQVGNNEIELHDCIFKDSGLPILEVTIKNTKLNLILDTASNVNIISSEHSDRVFGDISVFIQNTMHTVNGTDKSKTKHVFSDVSFGKSNVVKNEEFIIMDITESFGAASKELGVEVHGILGTSFLKNSGIIIDTTKWKK